MRKSLRSLCCSTRRFRSLSVMDIVMYCFTVILQIVILIAFFGLIVGKYLQKNVALGIFIGLLFASVMFLEISSYHLAFFMDPGSPDVEWQSREMIEILSLIEQFSSEYQKFLDIQSSNIPLVAPSPTQSFSVAGVVRGGQLGQSSSYYIRSFGEEPKQTVQPIAPTFPDSVPFPPPYTADRIAEYLGHSFCTKCSLVRPHRSHHCRSCKRCVLRMDHHCPNVGNCVGQFNNKQFYLFLVWTMLAMIIYCALGLRTTINFIFSLFKSFPLGRMWAWITIVGLVLLFLSVPVLLVTHAVLIRFNATTIEIHGGLEALRRNTRGRLMWNVEQVFGTNWRQWWNPFVVAEIPDEQIYGTGGTSLLSEFE